jgi:hypothetical protein
MARRRPPGEAVRPFGDSLSGDSERAINAAKIDMRALLIFCALFGAVSAQSQPLDADGPTVETLPVPGNAKRDHERPRADITGSARPVRARKIRYAATQVEALRCNAVLDLGNMVRVTDPSSQGRNVFVRPNRDTDRVPLWDLIILTNPDLKKLPAEEAYSKMYVIRDKYTSDHMGKYLQNIDLLIRDYKACQAKGLIRHWFGIDAQFPMHMGAESDG